MNKNIIEILKEILCINLLNDYKNLKIIEKKLMIVYFDSQYISQLKKTKIKINHEKKYPEYTKA